MRCAAAPARRARGGAARRPNGHGAVRPSGRRSRPAPDALDLWRRGPNPAIPVHIRASRGAPAAAGNAGHTAPRGIGGRGRHACAASAWEANAQAACLRCAPDAPAPETGRVPSPPSCDRAGRARRRRCWRGGGACGGSWPARASRPRRAAGRGLQRRTGRPPATRDSRGGGPLVGRKPVRACQLPVRPVGPADPVSGCAARRPRRGCCIEGGGRKPPPRGPAPGPAILVVFYCTGTPLVSIPWHCTASRHAFSVMAYPL